MIQKLRSYKFISYILEMEYTEMQEYLGIQSVCYISEARADGKKVRIFGITTDKSTKIS